MTENILQPSGFCVRIRRQTVWVTGVRVYKSVWAKAFLNAINQDVERLFVEVTAEKWSELRHL